MSRRAQVATAAPPAGWSQAPRLARAPWLFPCKCHGPRRARAPWLCPPASSRGVAATAAGAGLTPLLPPPPSLPPRLLTREGVLKTAKLPTIDALRGDLVATLVGPSYQLASTLDAPRMRTARALALSLEEPALSFARGGAARGKQLEEA